MSRWRFRTALGMAVLSGAVVSGCGTTAAVASPVPTTVVATASTASPGGALAGFLDAARAQDNTRVPAWLATSADATNLADLVRVYSDYSATDGIYWEVAGVRVMGVAMVNATHADVVLSGPVVWCLGMSAGDPAATCNAVTGVSTPAHTYAAIAVGGVWKADIDVNASTALDHNPQTSPTATGAAPSPS
jgi:hypothetical protein